MLFAKLHTRPARHRAPNEAPECDRRKDHDAGRGRQRRHGAVGVVSGPGALDGWKTAAPHSRDGGNPEDHEPVEVANLSDAIRQIVELRAMLREKQSEVEVLAEALEYVRSLSGEN